MSSRRRAGPIRVAFTFAVTYALLLFVLVRLGETMREPANLATARLTAALLRLLGAQGVAHETLVSSDLGTLLIIFECTGVFPCMLFLSAVLAYPGRLRAKLVGLGLGLPAILALNSVRVVSLFYVESRFPDLFDTVHVLIWPSVIVFFTLVLWLGWIVRFASPRAVVRA